MTPCNGLMQPGGSISSFFVPATEQTNNSEIGRNVKVNKNEGRKHKAAAPPDALNCFVLGCVIPPPSSLNLGQTFLGHIDGAKKSGVSLPDRTDHRRTRVMSDAGGGRRGSIDPSHGRSTPTTMSFYGEICPALFKWWFGSGNW